MKDFVGQQIDRYYIIERLGVGGMAVVYKAFDTRLERDVAIKLIRTEAIPQEQHERLFKRFEREAKAQARFKHNHIVKVFDYGEKDGYPYLVMDYVPGGTLKARIGQPIPFQQAAGWLIPIADALNYAHKRGVIHRDIKPSNILFDEENQPVLTDFGIAKMLETDEATLTGTGLGVGTPEYMAPEQWIGKSCEASDQYALGVVLYELLTGQKPYTADTPVAIALMQANEPLKAPSQIVKRIPETLEKVIYKALARNPRDRYGQVNDFKAVMISLLQSRETNEEAKGELVEDAKSQVHKPQNDLTDLQGQTVDHWELAKRGKKGEKLFPKQSYRKDNIEKMWLPGWVLWVGVPGLFLLIIGILYLSGQGRSSPAVSFSGDLTKDEILEVNEFMELTETPIIASSATATVTVRTTPTVVDTVAPTASAPFEYKVQEGDDCTSIAEEFYVDIEILILLNKLTSSCFISPGEIILIPAPGMELPTSTPIPDDIAAGTLIEYQIRSGDNLAALADQFESTVERILEETNNYRRQNNLGEIEDENDLYIGDILIIPVNIDTSEPTSTSTDTLGVGSTMVNPVDGAKMVYVPEGEFLMGSDDADAWDDEKPAHSVYLDAFWIYQTEVTNAQFASFVADTDYKTTAEKDGWSYVFDGSTWQETTGAYWGSPEGSDSNLTGLQDHPAIHISWLDAQAYCQWAGGSLPTEAEWEKAARGTDGRKYPWGNTQLSGEKANYCDVNCSIDWADNNQDDGYERTAPVGSYLIGASPYGALDMAGNVWEWVADWFAEDYYSRSSFANPTGPSSGDHRNLRGGSWRDNERNLRVSYRNADLLNNSLNDLGFRCLRSP